MQTFRGVRRLEKRLLSFLFIFIFLITTLLNPINVSASITTDVQELYIGLMSQERGSSDKVANLTSEDLRVLALYTSNAYIPMASYINTQGGDNYDKTLNSMVFYLEKAGMESKVAKSLAENCLRMSYNSATQVYINPSDVVALIEKSQQKMRSEKASEWADLYALHLTNTFTGVAGFVAELNKLAEICADVYWGHPYDAGGTDGADWHDNMSKNAYIDWLKLYANYDSEDAATYKDLMGESKTINGEYCVPISLEAFLDLCSCICPYELWGENDSSANNLILMSIDDKIPLYTENGNVVLNIDLGLCSRLSNCFNKLSTKANKGMASNSFFQTNDTESILGTEKVDDMMITPDMAKLNILTQKMYVDWVGNIIADIGNNQSVIVPACMNDIVFSEANTVPKFNFISTPALVMLADLNKNYKSGISITPSTDNCTVVFNYTGDAEPNGSKSILSKTGYGTIPFRTYVGSISKVSLDHNRGGLTNIEAFMNSLFTKKTGLDMGSFGANADEVTSYFRMPGIDSKTFDKSNAYLLMITDVKIGKSGAKERKFSQLWMSEEILQHAEKSDPSTKISETTDPEFYTVNDNLAKMILYTYIMASGDTAPEGLPDFDMTINTSAMPTPSDTTLNFDDVGTSEDIDTDIKSFIYYLLHPIKGIAYVTKLVGKWLSGLFVGWHEDIVGNTNSNVSLGMTKYLNTSSYITTPTIREISFLQLFVNYYDMMIAFILIVVIIILLCYVIIGQMNVWKALVGVLTFAILSFMPPIIIGVSLDVSNNICDRIYNQKFQYWGIVQLLEYLNDLKDQNEAENTQEYMETIIAQQADLDENATTLGFGGTRLKWMSPKHFTSYSEMLKEAEESGISSGLSELVTTAANNNGKEVFLENTDSQYIYRDILDIYTFGSYGYAVGDTWASKSIGTSDISTTAVKNQSNSKIEFPGYELAMSKYITGTSTITPLKVESIQYGDLIKANTEDSTASALADILKQTSSKAAIQQGFLYPTISDTTTNYWKSDYTNAAGLFINYSSALPQIQRTRYYIDTWGDGGVLNLSLRNLSSNRSGGGNNPARGYYNVSPNNSIVDGQSLPKASWLTTMPNKYFLGQLALYQVDNQDLWNNARDSSTLTVYNEPITSNQNSWAYESMSMYYYELYAESPYFYFYNNIKDQLRAENVGYFFDDRDPNKSQGTLYKMFLNPNYFKNMSTNNMGYGELRDFMNMHDLFYYIIPVMHSGNMNLYDFIDAYGLELSKDCPLTYNANDGTITYRVNGKVYRTNFSGTSNDLINNDEDTSTDSVSNGVGYKDYGINKLMAALRNDNVTLTDQQLYDIWHDYNIMYLYNFYSSWVSYMYASEYANTETITINGEDIVIEDPLNPISYLHIENNEVKGRPMIFSRSEMKYYGLENHQLTQVERKIIELQDTVYKETLDLMNYYPLADEPLITAYAFIQTFAFDSIFSQKSILHETYMIYPQAYEAKAFTYDTYLRMALANSSDSISLMSSDNTSIYRRIMSNSSIFFGVLLLLNDFFSVYAVPIIRLVIVSLLLIISILIIIASAIQLEFSFFNVLWKSLLAPLFSYVGITVGMAFILSLFMGQMADGVEITSTSISLGDPVATLFALIVINIMVIVAYWKVLVKLWKDFKVYIKTIVDNMSAALIGAFSTLTSLVRNTRQRHAYNSLIHGSPQGRGFGNLSAVGSRIGAAMGGMAAGAAAGGAAAGAVNRFDSIGRDRARQMEDMGLAAERAHKDAKLQAFNDKCNDFANRNIDKQIKDIDNQKKERKEKAKKLRDEINEQYKQDTSKNNKEVEARQKNIQKQAEKSRKNRKAAGEQMAKAQAKNSKANTKALNKRDEAINKVNKNANAWHTEKDKERKNLVSQRQTGDTHFTTFRKETRQVFRNTRDIAVSVGRKVSDVGHGIGNVAFTVAHPLQAASMKRQARITRGYELYQQQNGAM